MNSHTCADTSATNESTSFVPTLPLHDFEPFGALYIHVPFCKQRCNYCDFSTRALASNAPEMHTYTEQMILAIRRACRDGLLGSIQTIYLGGGTPTYLGQAALTELLYTLSLSLHMTEDVECSIEANPDSLNIALVRDLWALGVNRISIGVQSFNDTELAFLGRVHNASAARSAVCAAQDRFENVSIDLMCGIPGTTLESFASNVEEALALGVPHISIYPLTIEDNTPLSAMVNNGEAQDVDLDFQAACMELAESMLEGAGLHRYEVASYARPGFESKHNSAYWTGIPYLGLGPSAVSMAQNSYMRVRMQDGNEVERLDAAQMLAEDLMLGMRMSKGVSESTLDAARLVFPEFNSVAASLIESGLARFEDGRFIPTKRGWLCGNDLYLALLDLAP